MGDVINFRALDKRTAVETMRAQPQLAEILFFTGVRYQRDAEPSLIAEPSPIAKPSPIAEPALAGNADTPRGGAGGGRRKRRG